MSALLTAQAMRAAERRAIDSGRTTGAALMERAGEGVLDAILRHWPALGRAPGRAAVLCGPGNNGGDGFVIARLLAARGWAVELFLLGREDKLPPDAAAMRACWTGEVGTLSAAAIDAGLCHSAADLVIDALFGTGLTRPVDLPLDALREGCPDARVVAVDLPSGLCSDSGRVLGSAAVRADLTVTFHCAKPGHYLAEGPEHCGALAVADIGLPPETGTALRLARAPSGGLAKGAAGHKFSHGHLLVLSGGPGRTGAARLAARGALRIGAGLVTLAVPPAAQLEAAAQLTAVMLARLPDEGALAALLVDDRLNALCLGPGLGLEAREAALLSTALDSGRPLLLDADALTLLSREAALFDKLHPGCVLTPHPGEFKRLFPDLAARMTGEATRGPAFSRLDATRQAAARAGCTVLLKGHDTVIAAPEGEAIVSAASYGSAAPWLATAGAGDVLSGFIAGLLARGLPPMQAAEAAAWLHLDCARRFGPGLIAEDLPEALPGALRDLVG